MQVCRLFRVLVFAVVLLHLARSCFAADTERDIGLYVEGGASLYILEMPDYEPVTVRDGSPTYLSTRRLATYDDNAVGPLGSLTLGWQTATSWFFELTGRTFEDTGHSDRSFDHSAYGAYAVGFSFPTGALPDYFASSVVATTKTEARFSETGGRLVAGYALDLAPGVTLSPFVGGEVMHIDQAYELDWRSLTLMNLQEELETAYAGLLAGARLQTDWNGFRFGLTGSVAWYRLWSDYEGSMVIINSTRRDDLVLQDDAYATGLELAADVSRSWGPWSVGLRGGLRHLSDIPRIIASTKGPNGLAVYNRGTHIGSSYSKAYSLGLTLRYSF